MAAGSSSNRDFVIQEGAVNVVRGVQVRAPCACASGTPQVAYVHSRFALEQPLTAPPEPLRLHARIRRYRTLMRWDQCWFRC